MAVKFRDSWLEQFYENDTSHRKIPRNIEAALFRKIQILDAANKESDLKAPPGNRYERLVGKLHGWSSVRVNKQYRLIFCWEENIAKSTYLDPHVYRG